MGKFWLGLLVWSVWCHTRYYEAKGFYSIVDYLGWYYFSLEGMSAQAVVIVWYLVFVAVFIMVRNLIAKVK